MHFVTSTGQEIEVAAKSRLVVHSFSKQYNEADRSLGAIGGCYCGLGSLSPTRACGDGRIHQINRHRLIVAAYEKYLSSRLLREMSRPIGVMLCVGRCDAPTAL